MVNNYYTTDKHSTRIKMIKHLFNALIFKMGNKG